MGQHCEGHRLTCQQEATRDTEIPAEGCSTATCEGSLGRPAPVMLEMSMGLGQAGRALVIVVVFETWYS
jgi:hypothetical protein